MNIGPGQIILLGSLDADGDGITGVTATQSSVPINRRGAGILTFYFRSVGTTSGGSLTIEEADWLENEPQFEGTWSTLGAAVTAASFTGGAMLAVHVANSAYGWLRVRITGAITGGGNVIVLLRSQPGA